MAQKSKNNPFKKGSALAKIENVSKYFDGGVACNPNIKEEFEGSDKYVIVFTYYDSAICGISRIKSGREKIIVDLLKEINRKKPGERFRDIIRAKEATKDYSRLFTNLPKGVDVLVEVGKDRTVERVFGFTISNFFCVVSIDGEHLKSKTNKW